MQDDSELLREFVEAGSQEAFGKLVKSHIGAVYSTAFRILNRSDLANDVTQTVFLLLARKAPTLKRKTLLSGWLYRTTRFTAQTALRSEQRRREREEESVQMNAANAESVWDRIAPHLDDAMSHLSEVERNAIVLRFLEERSFQEVGAALGIKEDAARMRINRAVEKLRSIFSNRGFAVATTVLVGALSQASAKAMPAGLIESVITSVGASGGSAATIMTPLLKETLLSMKLFKIKVASGVIAGCFTLIASGIFVATNFAAEPKKQARADARQPSIRELWQRTDLTPEQREQLAKTICVDNLKKLGWGAKRWSDTNAGVLPPNWDALNGFVSSPDSLVCVSDTNRVAVTNWSDLRETNITYKLLSPNVRDKRPNTIVATCPIHAHVVLSTGQAFQGDYIRKNGLKIAANRLE